jgi:hypothetical protein
MERLATERAPVVRIEALAAFVLVGATGGRTGEVK